MKCPHCKKLIPLFPNPIVEKDSSDLIEKLFDYYGPITRTNDEIRDLKKLIFDMVLQHETTLERACNELASEKSFLHYANKALTT